MALALANRVRVARALRSRPFALLWAGQTFSSLGNGAYSTALAWQVLILTGSATAMGIVTISQTIPKLLFVLIGGAVADRLPRRLVMLWADAGRAIVVSLVAWLSWVHLLQLWHLIALSLFFSFIRGFFDPAYQAIQPQLVAKEALPSANALNSLSQQLNQLIGPLLGVGCVALAGPAAAFAFDGLTFLLSAVSLVAVRIPAPSGSPITSSDYSPGELSSEGRKPRQRPGLSALVRDIREGVGYVAGSTWLWVSILAASIANIGLAGPIVVALPKLVHDVYETGIWLLGTLTMASALGSITALLLIGQLHHIPRRGLLAYTAAILSSLAVLILGLPLWHGIGLSVAIGCMALSGFGLGAFEVIWITVMQELVPTDKLGRVSSIDMLGSFCLLPISYALAGILTDHVGPSWVFIGGGALSALVSITALMVPAIRRLK